MGKHIAQSRSGNSYRQYTGGAAKGVRVQVETEHRVLSRPYPQCGHNEEFRGFKTITLAALWKMRWIMSVKYEIFTLLQVKNAHTIHQKIKNENECTLCEANENDLDQMD